MDEPMREFTAVIAANTVLIYAAVVTAGWYFRARRGGPRERTLFVRGAVGYALFGVAVAAWVAVGIDVFLNGTVFWQGAFTGGSAVLWLAYVPALVWVVRRGRHHLATARAADMA